MVWWWWIVPAVVAFMGVATVFGALSWLLRGRPFRFLRGVIGGGLLLAIGAVASLVGMNIQTYHRLSYERPVATLDLTQKGPQLFDAVLTEPPTEDEPKGVTQTYPVHGDEWRVEARVLKWRPWATVLGLDTQYQLDRLSGRYEDTQDELHGERSVYDLRPVQKSGVDLWPLARRYSRYAPVVDTLYGSGASMPMVDGGKYEVWITQSGLIARPANPAANTAMATGWR
jgi:hypothetical protein